MPDSGTRNRLHHKLADEPDPGQEETHIGDITVDDIRCSDFFSHPAGTLQRRYEALRAVFLDHRPQKQVAEQFGYTYDSLRQLVHEFRCQCRRDAPPPFFSPSPAGDPTARPTPSPPQVP